MRSKLDSLVFTSDSATSTRTKDATISGDQSSLVPKSNLETSAGMGSKEAEVAVEIENVERPVDLYKVFAFHYNICGILVAC